MPCVPIVRGKKVVGSVSIGGPTLRIFVGGKLELFEMHDYCGPLPCTKAGMGREIAPTSRFWHAVTCWDRQGRRMRDGVCVWEDEVLDRNELTGEERVVAGPKRLKGWR